MNETDQRPADDDPTGRGQRRRVQSRHPVPWQLIQVNPPRPPQDGHVEYSLVYESFTVPRPPHGEHGIIPSRHDEHLSFCFGAAQSLRDWLAGIGAP
jgi:hypothetical protein